jgi:hypothetical protein
MATDESGFKQELKESIQKIFSKQFAWCPTDKIQSGVTDLHVIIDKFYGIEAKFCKSLPKRDSSNILSHPFSDKQIRFMTQLNNTGSAFGVGIVWLDKDSAVLIHPSQINKEGNISLGDVQKLYRDSDQKIVKRNGTWEIESIVSFSKRWS